MASSTSQAVVRDLQWLLTALRSETLIIHNVSFHHSQPSSNCHQENENSMTINIAREDSSKLSEILSSLSKSRLENIEFHRVEWESREMEGLGALLDGDLCPKQLVFRRNQLSRERMIELSEVLKRNKKVKGIVFSESEIGHVGAELLASSLRENETLEELEIWEDSIGTRGSEELSRTIEVSSSLKLLSIFDSSHVIASPLISAVLARNRSTEVHIWSLIARGDRINKSFLKVVEFFPENGVLRIYRSDGISRLACSLGLNSTVRSLDMTGVRLNSRWAKEFMKVLEQNQTLREVTLSKACLKNKASVYLAAGLFKNRALETLSLDGNRFDGIGTEHLLCPLTRFSPLQFQANTTLKSLTIGGPRSKIGRDGLSAILQFLTTNETLTQFGIHDDESLSPRDFVKIFEGMKRNASLKGLSLKGCKGIRGEAVSEAIMEALSVNPFLEEIDLEGTALQGSGEADRILRRLGQNGKSEESESLDSSLALKDMALMVPKSCRVFLCGQDYAGKATLCNSIFQNFSVSKLPYIDQVRTMVNPVEQAVRPVGMKIKTFQDEDDTKISIWNLAGHHEFHALHDLMFPGHGSASFFFIVSSLFRKPSNREPKTPSEIEEDLRYWLRFIVSNSKRAVQQCLLPSVTIVLTHVDKSDRKLQGSVEAIESLRSKFQGFVEFYPTVFTVDARSSSSVSKLAQHLRRTSKTILERVPRVYQLCDDLVRAISEWRSENQNKAAMKWKEFSELCQEKVRPLRIRSRNEESRERVESRRKAAATCLHHIGEVIYFDELGFLILDHEWFCVEVLGQLMRLGARKQGSGGGFFSKKELEKILKGSLTSQIVVPGLSSSKVFENLDANDLVKMMLILEVCYEKDPNDPNSLLLIPSILEEGRGRVRRWESIGSECVFVGRHLECDDSSPVLLTPGFFPRLQVNLHNKIAELRSQHGATYSLEKNLISITTNGMNIRVELGGQLGYFIDVLSCSTRNVSETLKFINQLVIPSIHAMNTHGVALIEGVIRPECVKNLTPPRYRKTQSVPLNRLKSAMLSLPAEGMYDYQHTWDEVIDPGSHQIVLKPGFDLTRDLLSDEEIREVLHGRYNDLYNLAVELQVQPVDEGQASNEIADSTVDPSLGGIAKGLEIVLERLKIIEEEIKDVKKEIQGLRYYEHRLLAELGRKLNYLVNYNVEIEERKLPNLFYFVRTENYSRRLVTTVISGMRALRLHMLCEFRREIHVVDDQMGCEMMQIDNAAVKSLAPYMSKFMTLVTFALKIGAHLAAGMGEMIPNLGREVAHLASSGSPLLFGAGIAGAAAVAAAASQSSSRGRDVQREQGPAKQWVTDFLRERRCSTGKEIAEKFGLFRVRYRDTGHVAWVCARHLSSRAHEVVELPV